MNKKLKILFDGKVPKEDIYKDSIEDFYEIRSDWKSLAVCDGASESYDSKSWAELLSKKYTEEPASEITKEWLTEAIEQYSNKHDFNSLSWSKQAAFNRGSFSTLLGVQFHDNRVQIDAIGDSVAVIIDDGCYFDSFPYKSSEEFQKHPVLVSTNIELNKFIDRADFHCYWEMNDKKSPKILCMTDALAEWALRSKEENEPIWEKLLEIKKQDDFAELIKKARSEKKMKIDDSTLIIVEFNKD